MNKTNISDDGKLLEIGAGTGQATIKFAQKGFNIHCIELGKNLAEILRKNTIDHDVTIDILPFEDWKPSEWDTFMPLHRNITISQIMSRMVKNIYAEKLNYTGVYLTLLIYLPSSPAIP